MTRLLIVGLDGATLDLIKPWATEGKLPALAALMQAGASGPLESTLPPVTSPAWPTFMTGKNPGKHGVFDFLRPSAGAFEMVNASQIDGKLLWEILSDAGCSVGVLNVPITYPPRKVNGYLVPGLLSPDQGVTTQPPDLLKPYRAELGRYRITPDVQYSPASVDAFVADIHDLIDTQLRYALRLMQDRPTDVLMVHFLASDNASHALWRYMDSTHPLHDPALAPKYGDALLKVYQHLDEAIQSLISNLQSPTSKPQTSNFKLQTPTPNIIVMSDHGFGPLHKTVNLNVLFLQAGLMHLKPHALTRLRYAMFKRGLTPKGVYRMLERMGLQNVSARVSRQTRNQLVSKFLSFEDVDWSRTVAYAMGHVGQVYLNLKGREPEGIVEPSAYHATRQKVVDVLKTLHDPQSGRPQAASVRTRAPPGRGVVGVPGGLRR